MDRTLGEGIPVMILEKGHIDDVLMGYECDDYGEPTDSLTILTIDTTEVIPTVADFVREQATNRFCEQNMEEGGDSQ